MSAHDPEFVKAVKDLAASDTLAALFDGMSETYMAAWRRTKPEATTEREHLWRMIKAVEGVAQEIASIARSEERLNAVVRVQGRRTPLAF